MRSAVRWVFPGGLVLGAAAVILLRGRTAPDGLVALLTERYALLVPAVGAALAIAFHRSRVFVAVLLLGAAELGLRTGFVPPEHRLALGSALCLLLGAATLARDRGLTSPAGLAQMTVAATLAGAFALAVRFEPDLLEAFRPTSPGAGVPMPEALTGLPPAVLGCTAGGLVLLSYAVARWRAPVERGMVWAFIATVAAVHPEVGLPAASILLMAAGLILGLSVLETSYAMAYRDELTGLPARRSLMRDLEGLTGTYTLAMVDVDHFKKFNDRHGHEVGDQVLKLVASRLARAPGGGRAYRYGGEEFTLLYRGRTRDEAEVQLETVRESVASARFALRRWSRPVRKEAGKARRGKGAGSVPRSLSVTVSIGMADSTGAAADLEPEAVLARADKALYRAKRAGRNRVAR